MRFMCAGCLLWWPVLAQQVDHHLEELPVRVQLGTLARSMTRQAGPVARQTGIEAFEGVNRVVGELSRYSTGCTAQVSGSHHHDSGSIFSSEMALAVSHGNTVPDGLRVALGH